MARFAMQIDTAHPVLFLSDSQSVSSPPTDDAAFVGAAEDSLCFRVLSHVDGASAVTLSDEPCPSGGEERFDGGLEAPSGVLSLTDSGGFRYLNVPVPEGRVKVLVSSDDDQNPDWVWVQLGAIRPL